MTYQLDRVNIDDVVWSDGFWSKRFEVCHQTMVPNMWHLLKDDDLCHAFANFEIAAGMKEGHHRGPKWHDGDFYKWLEAAASTYAITKDPDLDALMDRAIDVIGKSQQTDGYLFTPVIIARDRNGQDVQPFQDPVGFEMYNFGHLMTAGCIHYEATGKKSLLDMAIRAGDYLCDVFRDPTPEQAVHSICPSHYMGLIDLYRMTGQSRYLDLVKTLVRMRDLIDEGTDDNQTRVLIKEQTEAVGHAVRANYLYAGLVDVCTETEDRALFELIEKVWEDVAYRKVYITGGCGALYDGASPDGSKNQKVISRVHQAYGRAYQLPNLTAYGETCANIGYALWSWRMLQMTGHAQYADMIETVLYNSGLASISLDGKRFFYVNTLERKKDMPFDLRWSRTREPYISCFCCPPNIVRIIAMANRWAYAQSEDGVWVVLYGSNRANIRFSDDLTVGLVQETDYPWAGKVKITVETPISSAFGIFLRIPEWAGEISIAVNGEATQADGMTQGFARLDRTWCDGDVIELDFPMDVHVMEAHPLVEENRNQVAVKRGPLVYCLESHDLSEGVDMADVVIPQDIALKPQYEPHLLDGVVVLEGTAKAIESEDWSKKLYRQRTPRKTRDVPVRFIPYYAWDNRGMADMSVWLPSCDG